MGIWRSQVWVRRGAVAAVMTLVGQAASQDIGAPSDRPPLSSRYSGSTTCRSCHESFYGLWSTSHHGLAMQPYTAQFAKTALTAQTEPIAIGPYAYRAVVDGNDPNAGVVLEKGTQGLKTLRIEHVMGGKNVYFFLTPLAGGRWQVLPVAYDVRRRQWYDTTDSMIRHVHERPDAAIDWRDPALTFNTSCHSCHVSQLSPNYDPNTDTFRTVWAESGINCETCHGPAAEHARVCQQAPKDRPPTDLKLVTVNRKRGFSGSRIDSACAPCHAKMMPVTGGGGVGDDYFDHYGLGTLEDPDFFPDGRDLGENFTYTLWRMSPCVKSGKLDCLHCHTSSGRYRFADPNQPNHACLPCHAKRVENATEHTHHLADGPGNRCIACHMPTTEFALMRRSDHSMRPPMPAATIAFGSPNACTLCHKDKDAAWADIQVRAWRKRDFQAPVLHVAGLIAAARKGNWSMLVPMLGYLQDKTSDEIYANSLVRLLAACPDDRKWPVLLDLLRNNPSPLIRGSAAEGLAGHLTPQVSAALSAATRDPVRLVRVRAAAGLLTVAGGVLPGERSGDVRRAIDEYLAGLKARGHQWDAQYNLGNFYMGRQQIEQAVRHFQWAVQLRPDNPPALINSALCYNQLGHNDRAEKALREVVRLDPNSVPAHLNLGLLLGELGRFSEAGAEFQTTLRLDPNSAVAAYNLGVILSRDKINEAIIWCRKAYQLQPKDGKYGYTYAYYLYQNGRSNQAIDVLTSMVDQQTDSVEAYVFLGQIYQDRGQIGEAVAVYSRALQNPRLPQEDRDLLMDKLRTSPSRP